MKPLSLLSLLLLFLLLPLPSLLAAPTPAPGTPIDQLIEEKGQPASSMTIGSRQILKWPDLKVTAAKGVVLKAEAIDAAEVQRQQQEQAEVAKQAQVQMQERIRRKEALMQQQQRQRQVQPRSSPSKPMDYKELKQLQDSARNGNTRAQIDLANRYLRGNGVGRNEREAYRYFEMAANKGYSTAQYNLGMMYLNGQGVPRNPQLAKDWFSKAADSRHRDACFQLGKMYEEGRYVGRDIEEAYICYTLAAQGRHPEAAKKRSQLSKMLTADQLRNADSRLVKKRFWRY